MIINSYHADGEVRKLIWGSVIRPRAWGEWELSCDRNPTHIMLIYCLVIKMIKHRKKLQEPFLLLRSDSFSFFILDNRIHEGTDQ